MSKQRPSSQGVDSAPVTREAVGYWSSRLFRNTYTRAGKRISVANWSVKIQHQGRRHTFSLSGKTKATAALEAKSIYATLVTEGWQSALRSQNGAGAGDTLNPKADIQYWREQVLLRRYRFPASGESDLDLSVRIDHAGIGCFFPLGTPDPEWAATKAHEIYWTAVKQGWDVARRRYSRELIIGFEWCANPILWTYTTVHTLVSTPAARDEAARSTPEKRRVLIVETAADLREALQWCVNQQEGFAGIGCVSVEAFAEALELQKPWLVLVNRSLAARIGIESPGGLASIQPGVTALTYSVFVDGDQMFVSTPGGAEGYMLKRVAPGNLLDPMITPAWMLSEGDNDPLRNVKAYFRQLLQPRSAEESPGLARLTPREHEVLTLLVKGCVDKEIAQALGISAWTVHGHIKKIFERLQVRSRTEAVVRYLEK